MVSGPAIYASGMKYRRLALLLLLVALIVAGCKSTDRPPLGSRWQLVATESSEPPAVALPDEGNVADPLDGTRWQLVAMTGLDDTLALLSDDVLLTLSFQEGGFRFDTGCNNPGGNYVVRGSQLEVSAVRTTTMLCSQQEDDPAPQVESALATIASTLESYSISGAELRLGYPSGELVLKRLPDKQK